MEIKYLELLKKDGTEILDIISGKCCADDVEIQLDNGALFVKAEKSELYGIKLHIKNTYFKYPYILSDAWESAYGKDKYDWGE